MINNDTICLQFQTSSCVATARLSRHKFSNGLALRTVKYFLHLAPGSSRVLVSCSSTNSRLNVPRKTWRSVCKFSILICSLAHSSWAREFLLQILPLAAQCCICINMSWNPALGNWHVQWTNICVTNLYISNFGIYKLNKGPELAIN